MDIFVKGQRQVYAARARKVPAHVERLDGENGLLLTPTIDHLFDRGFISFEDDGRLLVSPVADAVSLRRMGVPAEADVGGFSRAQGRYLEFHRDEVFLTAGRERA